MYPSYTIKLLLEARTKSVTLWIVDEPCGETVEDGDVNCLRRILRWRSTSAPVLPAYPVERDVGTESVAVDAPRRPVELPTRVGSMPAQIVRSRTKPWNKPKAARNIAAGVVEEIRACECEGALTIPEIDEWITAFCGERRMELGGLTYGAIRMAMKRCSGVRFQNRRLIAGSAYEPLRRRYTRLKRPIPDRAWIFIIDAAPEFQTSEMQLGPIRVEERRAA